MIHPLDTSEDFQKYAKLVPEYQKPRSKRAEAELKKLTHDGKNEALPENEAQRNIRIIQEVVRGKVEQLQGNLIWKKHLHIAKEGGRNIVVGCTDEEYQQAPRTDLKTFQDILSDPTERIAFTRKEKLANARHINISPKRISNTLLRNLGLDEFLPEKGMRQEDQVARRAQAIPALKEMLDALAPFSLPHEQELAKMHYFRLFRLGAGKNEGKVLGTQAVGNKKILFMTDLHGAYRRIDHIQDGYSEEIATLIEIENTVEDVDVSLSTEWEQTKDPEQLKEVKAKLLGLVQKLRFVTNANKQKMRDQIEAAVTLETVYTIPEKKKSSLGGGQGVTQPARTIVKLNPGAARARINTTHLHVGKRIDEITAIKKYLAEDQTRIEVSIEAQTQPFTQFHETVRKMHEQFHIYQLARPMDENERKTAIRNLRSLRRKSAFATSPIMMFEPYQAFAMVMVEQIDSTIEELMKKEDPSARQKAASEFTKIYLMTKIQRFYTELQAVYAKFISGDELPDFEKLDDELARIYKFISLKDVAKGIETKEFNAVFGDLYHLVHGLRKDSDKARQALITGTDETVAKPFIDMIRNRFKNFDFVQLMGKIGTKPNEPEGHQGPEGNTTNGAQAIDTVSASTDGAPNDVFGQVSMEVADSAGQILTDVIAIEPQADGGFDDLDKSILDDDPARAD